MSTNSLTAGALTVGTIIASSLNLTTAGAITAGSILSGTINAGTNSLTAGNLTVGDITANTLNLSSTTDSTNPTSGALVVSGGIGIKGSLSVGGTNGINITALLNGWVAVGTPVTGKPIAYSPNGSSNWNAVSGTDSIFTASYGVAYWNGLLVAVGQGNNTIAYSRDAVNWTGVSGSNTIFSTGYGVAYGNGLWVAVGSGTNTIAYSTNGINWTGLGNSILNINGYGVAYGNGLWVAVGKGGTYGNVIAYSTSGSSGWTGLGNSGFFVQGQGVAYGNGRWCAVGDNNNAYAIFYSNSGSAGWIGANSSIFFVGYGVTYANNLWMAVGYGKAATNSIAYSGDAINWYAVDFYGLTFFTIGCGIAYANGLWVAVGYGPNTIAYSTSGSSGWTGLGNVGFDNNSGTFGRGICFTVPSSSISLTSNNNVLSVYAPSTSSGALSVGTITSGNISLTGNAVSTNITTGSLVVTGGVGISGNISIGGNIFCSKGIAYVGSIQNTSDYRIKANVELLGSDFSVSKLVPVKYYNKLLRKDDVGFIAHEVQEVFPQFVEGEKDGEGYQSVNYTGLIAILVKEIQHLKRENLEIRQELQEIRRAVGLI
jgi:hypothetical protein